MKRKSASGMSTKYIWITLALIVIGYMARSMWMPYVSGLTNWVYHPYTKHVTDEEFKKLNEMHADVQSMKNNMMQLG